MARKAKTRAKPKTGRRATRSATRGARRGLTPGSPKIARSRRAGTISLAHQGGGVGQFAKRRGGGYRGFKSKAQWRWAWATHKPWARKKAHETKGGKVTRYRRLPRRKGGPTARTARG